MDIEELFVEIPGFSNYVVSNFGSVINIARGYDMTPSYDSTGRYKVNLSANGITKTLYVHRLVAQAFFINYNPDVHVRHINGDFNDNTVFNLTLVFRTKASRL